MKKVIILFCGLILSFGIFAEELLLISPDGTYLGKIGASKYDSDSISNPYGEYGSKYGSKSINNPYGEYGSKYSNKSPNNPYATQKPFLIKKP